MRCSRTRAHGSSIATSMLKFKKLHNLHRNYSTWLYWKRHWTLDSKWEKLSIYHPLRKQLERYKCDKQISEYGWVIIYPPPLRESHSFLLSNKQYCRRLWSCQKNESIHFGFRPFGCEIWRSQSFFAWWLCYWVKTCWYAFKWTWENGRENSHWKGVCSCFCWKT